jgi:hypothetical protein
MHDKKEFDALFLMVMAQFSNQLFELKKRYLWYRNFM